MNFANSLSTACLHNFVLSKPEIVLQRRDPFHYVFSPSVVLDKTKWWTKSGQSLSYTDTWHQDVLIKTRLYLPRAVTSMYCFLKSRIFFMQQNIHRLGIIQRSNCRRHRDKLKYKLSRTPGVPGVSTRIPKINTTWRLQCSGIYIFLLVVELGRLKVFWVCWHLHNVSVFPLYMSRLWFPWLINF